MCAVPRLNAQKEGVAFACLSSKARVYAELIVCLTVSKFNTGTGRRRLGSHPLQAINIPAERRAPEASSELSSISGQQASRGKMAYRIGVPRVAPRHALNPDLFDDRKVAVASLAGLVETGNLHIRGNARSHGPPQQASISPAYQACLDGCLG